MSDTEQTSSPPGSPAAAPLQPMSPDRVNQQREGASLFSPSPQNNDNDVHDKIRQFNNMAHTHSPNTQSMSKQLERKTADAALKRAMLGREAAESEMRRYRDEVRVLRKQIEEGRERERRVGERLETVMENYGRAKETHSHTQALWEKEIRRARKETFKSQSTIVKLQEELKAARATIKSMEELQNREKERSKSREQEAFEARYQIVGVQEQLEKALERVKAVEHERDAYKTLAKNEELARIAAEGRIPLPPSKDADDEFASPRKARVPLTTTDIVSSAASEAEIDELTRLWQWEKQRADRTQEQLEFLQAECELRVCACAKSQSRKRRSSTVLSPRRDRPAPIPIIDPADRIILGRKSESLQPQIPEQEELVASDASGSTARTQEEPKEESKRRESRQGTIFVPSEGIFRTLSQQEIQSAEKSEEATSEATSLSDVKSNPSLYARTPSVDPPSFALLAHERTSLLSLLNAPHGDDSQAPLNIPTVSADSRSSHMDTQQTEEAEAAVNPETDIEMPNAPAGTEPEQKPQREKQEPKRRISDSRCHTCSEFYTVTETTSVPLRDDTNHTRPHTIAAMPMPAANGLNNSRMPSFDVNNPALTPTMTREQALAQIKERRGRARSAAQGAATPRRQMIAGAGPRREVSAPVGRGGARGGAAGAAAAAKGRT
ncbi:hypothetical protein DL770_002678 [Monosporascus sp. CRB-9-2]|nr:hypothetical protein DL770_002678 [Monosporascus sp. CRB-9-2]